VGGNGDGQTTKVANQIIVALNIRAVACCSPVGLRHDPAKVRPGADGVASRPCTSWIHTATHDQRTSNRAFRIELHRLNLALQGAKVGVSPAAHGQRGAAV
jgi:2-hydroxy-3-oxopropionate reductase